MVHDYPSLQLLLCDTDGCSREEGVLFGARHIHRVSLFLSLCFHYIHIAGISSCLLTLLSNTYTFDSLYKSYSLTVKPSFQQWELRIDSMTPEDQHFA